MTKHFKVDFARCPIRIVHDWNFVSLESTKRFAFEMEIGDTISGSKVLPKLTEKYWKF